MKRPRAYYNENDPQKAAWIRELIKAGTVAPGEVDERDIRRVHPKDYAGFSQCHFFAGIAVWSYALRLAGWPDEKEVWTGSCPCPSFSSAGKGQGFDDARHLWPDWFRLIDKSRPPTIFGEQSDEAIEYGWLDLVQANLESAAYSVGKTVFGACSVGAPEIRLRLWFVANPAPSQVRPRSGEIPARAWAGEPHGPGNGSASVRLASSADSRRKAPPASGAAIRASEANGRGRGESLRKGSGGGLANSASDSQHRDWKSEEMGAEFAAKHFAHPRGKALSQEVKLASWATPQASDDKGTSGGRGRAKNPGLRVQASLAVSGPELIGFSAERGMIQVPSGAQLSPEHSRWLMALPPVFSSCAVTAMQSTRKRRGRSSKPTCK